MSEHRAPTYKFQLLVMVSFTAYCVLLTYYAFFRLRDCGPLAVAQQAPLIRHCPYALITHFM